MAQIVDLNTTNKKSSIDVYFRLTWLRLTPTSPFYLRVTLFCR